MSNPFLRVGAAVATVLLVLAGVTYGFWRDAGATAAALDDHGVVTTATVEALRTDTRRVRTGDRSRTETDYLVTYAFEALAPADGAPVSQRVEHEVPQGVFSQLRRGQEVEIRYLPEDPTRADFYPNESRGEARVLGWVMAAMLGAAATALGVALAISGRAQRAPVAGGSVRSA